LASHCNTWSHQGNCRASTIRTWEDVTTVIGLATSSHYSHQLLNVAHSCRIVFMYTYTYHHIPVFSPFWTEFSIHQSVSTWLIDNTYILRTIRRILCFFPPETIITCSTVFQWGNFGCFRSIWDPACLLSCYSTSTRSGASKTGPWAAFAPPFECSRNGVDPPRAIWP